MKEKIKTIIYFILFLIFIVFAIVLYKKLLYKNISTESSKISNDSKSKIPDFEIYTENNKKVNIKEYIGKPIVINIWTSWCEYCNLEMPYFNQLYLKEKDNVVFIMLNATGDNDTIENANKLVRKNNYKFDVYYDLNLEALEALKIYNYPTTIFIDKNGYINYIKIGAITNEELVNKINELK